MLPKYPWCWKLFVGEIEGIIWRSGLYYGLEGELYPNKERDSVYN